MVYIPTILWCKPCSSQIDIAKGSVRFGYPLSTATMSNTLAFIYEVDKGQLRLLNEEYKTADGRLKVYSLKRGTYLIGSATQQQVPKPAKQGAACS